MVFPMDHQQQFIWGKLLCGTGNALQQELDYNLANDICHNNLTFQYLPLISPAYAAYLF